MFNRISLGPAICLLCWSNIFAAGEAFAQVPSGTDPYLSTSASGEVEPYTHNGSDVIIETRGKSVHIRYEKPRAGLASVGAKPGTLLFAGTRSGDDVEGIAYVFKANCSPAPYSVRGRFNSRFNLTLEGNASQWQPRSCEISTYTNSTRNARLLFLEAFGDM